MVRRSKQDGFDVTDVRNIVAMSYCMAFLVFLGIAVIGTMFKMIDAKSITDIPDSLFAAGFTILGMCGQYLFQQARNGVNTNRSPTEPAEGEGDTDDIPIKKSLPKTKDT